MVNEIDLKEKIERYADMVYRIALTRVRYSRKCRRYISRGIFEVYRQKSKV